MTKNDLMEMARKSGATIKPIGDTFVLIMDDLPLVYNSILERAAVECYQGVSRMSNDIDGTAFYIATGQCAKAIRSLKLHTN